MAALSRKGLEGAVRLGIPDDYAESFLAEILTRFNRRHPLVEVSVVCENSIELAAQVAAGALELALVTDHEGLQGVRTAARGAAGAGRLPSGSGSRRARRSRWRWAAPICIWRRVAEDGARRRPAATPRACSFPRTTPQSARSCARASRRRSCPSHGRRRPARARARPRACPNCR